MTIHIRNTHILIYLVVYLSVLISSISASSSGPTPLLLSCGLDEGGTSDDGRKWVSDSKYLASPDKSIKTIAQSQDPSLSSTVPYMTGRIFTSETAYKFPIKGKDRHILRLHFYPSTYPDYNISNSFFSVTAGGITLLNNFSAFLTAEAMSQVYIIKEYTLAPLDDDVLTLTLKPSDKYHGSFVLINGIEVVPSPQLFDDDGQLVGFTGDETATMVASSTNMELMYRLNVAGKYIAPVNDSGGLMRRWYDDTMYLYGSGIGATDDADKLIQYKDLPEAMAPVEVYSNARTMGPEWNLNKDWNLTWVFPVDANFTYLVRVHLCEVAFSRPSERTFFIYINNQTALNDTDVAAWVGKDVATKKDFGVYVRDMPGDDLLWLALHPNIPAGPSTFDVLLNGLEIFKMADAKSNLAGPNPTMSDMMRDRQQADQSKQEFSNEPKKSYVGALVGGAAGGAAAFGVAAAICFVSYNRKKRIPGANGHTSSWLPIYGNSHTSGSKSTISGKSHGSTTISSDAACNCRYFSLTEIKHATKNFDESHVIGVGGFGKVYKGIIDSDTKVAIKRSNPSSEQGVNEFQTEIEMLSKLRHRHLVSLIGFCEENNEMILVYDYMGHGTLREHLYKGNKITLSWKQRLEICIGAARGLHYLHTGAKYTIIHRDVKTTNILLDDKWVAKVSDFGLSKTGPNMNQGHVSTVVKGSFGYLDPEYFRRQQLTEKSDVYSFGVVLFEVLCARPALNPSLSKEQVSLADYALHCQRKGSLEDIIDPHLKGKICPEGLKKFAETAEKCLADHGTDRPSMGDVLWNLEFAFQMETGTDGAKLTSSTGGSGSVEYDNLEPVDHNSFLAMHRSTLSLGSEHDAKEEPEDNIDDIFSQIVNPKGR